MGVHLPSRANERRAPVFQSNCRKFDGPIVAKFHGFRCYCGQKLTFHSVNLPTRKVGSHSRATRTNTMAAMGAKSKRTKRNGIGRKGASKLQAVVEINS